MLRARQQAPRLDLEWEQRTAAHAVRLDECLDTRIDTAFEAVHRRHDVVLDAEHARDAHRHAGRAAVVDGAQRLRGAVAARKVALRKRHERGDRRLQLRLHRGALGRDERQRRAARYELPADFGVQERGRKVAQAVPRTVRGVGHETRLQQAVHEVAQHRRIRRARRRLDALLEHRPAHARRGARERRRRDDHVGVHHEQMRTLGRAAKRCEDHRRPRIVGVRRLGKRVSKRVPEVGVVVGVGGIGSVSSIVRGTRRTLSQVRPALPCAEQVHNVAGMHRRREPFVAQQRNAGNGTRVHLGLVVERGVE